MPFGWDTGSTNQLNSQLMTGGQQAMANQGAYNPLGDFNKGYYANQQQQTANQPALQQLAFQKQKFNQLFPMLQGAFNQSQRGGTGGATGNYGYGAPAAPNIPAPNVAAPPAIEKGNIAAPGALAQLGPAISQGQINANVNLNNAQNWSQQAGASRRAAGGAGGSGVGATSPLAKALQAQLFGGALAANTAGATQARMQGAQLNAEQARANQAAQAGYLASTYGSQVGAQASEYGARAGQAASQYGTQAGAQNSQYGALLDALQNQYGTQANIYGSQLGLRGQLAGIGQSRQNAILQALSSLAG